MEAKLVVLKLFLEALGVAPKIDNVEDRKRVQKAVYLGQRFGVDLGYRFNWYVMGPYSPALTRDYYKLSEELESESEPDGAKSLRDEAAKKLDAVIPLLTPPKQVDLTQADWLELLASYDYLMSVSKYSDTKAKELLEKTKPHVSHFLDDAQKTLHQSGFLLQSAM